MSREAVVLFLNRIRTDSVIRTELERAPTRESYLELGKRAGCEFSLEELRSVTNAEQFYGEAQKDPSLSRRLSSAPDEASVVALAKEAGFECQLEDLQAVLLGSMGSQLSDEQLSSVAGGVFGWSFPNVSKTPSPFGPIPIPYPNF